MQVRMLLPTVSVFGKWPQFSYFLDGHNRLSTEGFENDCDRLAHNVRGVFCSILAEKGPGRFPASLTEVSREITEEQPQ